MSPLNADAGTQAYPLLEFLRVLASLSVILWHYQLYFFTTHPLHGEALREIMPLSGLLWIFYNEGFYAVQWFWVLSGFVFFSTYRDALERDQVSEGTFFLRRFARLYPLHLLTLLCTAALLGLHYLLFGEHFPWYTSDMSLRRFASHLFMASNWLTSEHTFNAPIWSVSIEVLVYVIFLLVTKYVPVAGFVKSLMALCFAAATGFVLLWQKGRFEGAWIEFQSAAWLIECLMCFYLGGLVYDLHLAVAKRISRPMALGAFAACSGVGLAAWFLPPRFAAIILPVAVIFVLVKLGGRGVPRSVARASWVGNLTYGSYLVHFPCALTIIIAMKVLRFDPNLAFSPLFLLAYLATVFALAALSYCYVEAPARRVIRDWHIRVGASLAGYWRK